MNYLYLDHCSTTPLDPVVADVMRSAALDARGNPASLHQAGQAARRLLEDARARLARRLGADIEAVDGERLVITSGGTESNNLALFGLVGEPPGRVIVSAVEHPSVLAAAGQLRLRGFDCQSAPVDVQGRVQLDALENLLTPDARLVSIQYGNHETGVVQPIAEIAELCRRRGVRMHCDAVQAVGKTPLDFRQLQLDALTFTAHKLHGPVGVGGLLLRPGVVPTPQLWGGTQQLGLRPGTESVMLTVGFATAFERYLDQGASAPEHLAARRDQLEARLTAGAEEVVVAGLGAPRLPHVLNAAFLGCDRQSLLLALDRAGVACSSGPACQSGASEPSAVLRAMGLSQPVLNAALRFSVGLGTTAAEVDDAADRILKIVNDLRRRAEARKYAAPPRLSDAHRL